MNLHVYLLAFCPDFTGGYEVHRVNLRTQGGSFSAQAHREPGSVLYTSQVRNTLLAFQSFCY